MASRQLLTTIDGELRWREAELALSKLHLHKSLLDMRSFEYSYRCMVVLTYAHYEAFTKLVIAQSLADIISSGVKWSECCESIQVNLFAGRLRDRVRLLPNKELAQKATAHCGLFDDLPAPDVSIILDCGNLNNQNFDWAVQCVGLDPKLFSGARRDIGRITALRHECAHGEKLTFDVTRTSVDLANDLFELQSRIILLLHMLSVELIDHFTTLSFKK